MVDDIKINGKLTLGEDVADLGGTMLAYIAWKAREGREPAPQPVDGFTPDQRFFIGMAQWACGDERPEHCALHAITDPHSPGRSTASTGGVEHAGVRTAFACKPGQPMARENRCRVW